MKYFLSSLLLPLFSFLFDSNYFHFNSHLFLCLFDNFSHGFLSFLLWLPNYSISNNLFLYFNLKLYFSFYDIIKRYFSYFEVILSFIFGCLLDIDHFISSGSFSLFSATHLNSRPFGHSFTFIFILSVSTLLITLLFYSSSYFFFDCCFYFII